MAEARQHFLAEAIRGTCDTGRYRCSYWTWGDGPPLVFVHGLADRAASFLLPAYLLARQFRCIAYELPEGGSDGANLRLYGHADLVADLGALLDSLRIVRSYLFGSSFGSTIVLEALRSQPSRFPRAMLQGGFARRPLHLGERLLASTMRFCPGQLRHLPFRRRGMYRHCKGPLAERPDLWEYFLECAGEPRTQAVARRALLLAGLDLRAHLDEVRQPVLLICGDFDPLVGKDCEAELLRGLPSTERIEIPGCGHYPYFSHPEVLTEIIRMFLSPRNVR